MGTILDGVLKCGGEGGADWIDAESGTKSGVEFAYALFDCDWLLLFFNDELFDIDWVILSCELPSFDLS